MSTTSELPIRPSLPRENEIDEAARFHLMTLLWMAGISVLLVPMATVFDVSIARWFAGSPLPSEVTSALDLTLVFAHASGIFLIIVSVMLLAPKSRWHVPRIATLAMGGGAVATLAKMFVLRPRPSALNLEANTFESAWIWSFDWSLSQVASFENSTRAFPSANVATATAFTVGLWFVFPRGRWLFVGLCIGTMLQQLYCGAHFLSDLFGSAAVGFGWAYLCQHPRLLGNIFDKMEPELHPRRKWSAALPLALPNRPTPEAESFSSEVAASVAADKISAADKIVAADKIPAADKVRVADKEQAADGTWAA